MANGEYSLALGRCADTNGNDGAVVLGDSTDTTVQAQASDEVRSQMPVYAPSFHTTSARTAKQAVEAVDPQSVLEEVASLSVNTWELSHGDGGRHMGPMAGEFQDAFDLGDADGSIATVDADGVALAAIRGVTERLDERDERIAELEAENEALRERLERVEARLAARDTDDTDLNSQPTDTDHTERS
ncbi:MAG: hypothetical protein ABEH88_11930 [Halobacteriales archaeon]